MKKQSNTPIRSILIILTASLGDVVRGFAVIKPIKEQLPDVKLTWLIEDKWKTIAECVSGIDELLVFERKQGWRGVRKIYHDLRCGQYDVVLDMQRHLKSGAFSFLSGAKRRIGFAPKNSHEFNYIFNNEYIPECKCESECPKIYQYMKFVEQLGLKWQEPLDFGFNLGGVTREDAIGIVLGSSRVEKDWPKEKYLELVNKLIGQFSKKIILLGDKSQIAAGDAVVHACKSDLITNKVGKTTLVELLKILAGVTLVVGPDSGPGHMAAALKTPYIALFGPTEVKRVCPYNCENLVIQAPSKRVPDITVDSVLAKVKEVLGL